MIKQKYVYWKDDDTWLGYLEEFPDYWTQGEAEEELKENLADLFQASARAYDDDGGLRSRSGQSKGALNGHNHYCAPANTCS